MKKSKVWDEMGKEFHCNRELLIMKRIFLKKFMSISLLGEKEKVFKRFLMLDLLIKVLKNT
jgi:hypothetical protein